MKQQWLKLASRIDALSLRERCIIFAAVAFALVSLLNIFVLEPQFAKQTQLSQQIKQDQAKMIVMRAQISQMLKSRTEDPDAADRAQLQQLKQQVAQLNDSLSAMQKGLVPPERMSALLEDILKRDGSLRLMSLKTLPVANITEAVDAPAKNAAGNVAPAGAAAAPAAGKQPEAPADALIYRHGVELVVRGSYPDMVRYMAQLETMPMQVFWGKAHLEVEAHPVATLSLTLYTLSLDKKWLNL
ncbi:MSHA biogenesis protein MshJ [Paucimonas lemoignei]|uniref:MSHA biogenesis protein MshJ n=1 Tax=Paucimonas lemoignei TaxID=29443 RepID=A0A4R3I0M9_PAULE|nr:MSHA biogenesis protein MshJ [Paucimonas lemoignei]TCS39082.1 MSHA biogenesis protein MshJ [Paucimonas lemoignei]